MKRVGNRHWEPLAILRDQALSLRAKGLSVRKIAGMLGASKSWVHWVVQSTEEIPQCSKSQDTTRTEQKAEAVKAALYGNQEGDS